MNQTIDLILSHRSIRQFTAEPIVPQQLDAILAAAQSASTSSFLQVTSIVRVSEPEARQQLAVLAGNQPYVV
ncbi:TPA: nitroreductase family protein, partial [Aeromonas veronii]